MIRVIGMIALVAGLAYVLGRPWVRRWEDHLGITQLAIAGLPFVLLGMLARSPAVNVLDDELLRDLQPSRSPRASPSTS